VRHDHTYFYLEWSNKIQGFVVVLIPLQLTLSCILKCCQHNIPYLYDLPNSTSLAQHVVSCSGLPITEIFTIEEHKLDNTFLHATLGLQSLLRTTSDLTGFYTNWRIEEATRGGVNGCQLKFFHRIWPTQAMFLFKNMMNTLTNRW
jgi:hypothetical protein